MQPRSLTALPFHDRQALYPGLGQRLRLRGREDVDSEAALRPVEPGP